MKTKNNLHQQLTLLGTQDWIPTVFNVMNNQQQRYWFEELQIIGTVSSQPENDKYNQLLSDCMVLASEPNSTFPTSFCSSSDSFFPRWYDAVYLYAHAIRYCLDKGNQTTGKNIKEAVKH